MATFNDFAQKARDVAGSAWDKARDVADFAVDKARDVKNLAKLNLEISSEQRDLDKNYRSIGQWYVSEFRGEAPDAIRDVLAAIQQNKAKLADLEQQKAALKAETNQEVEPEIVVEMPDGEIKVEETTEEQ